MDKQLLGRQFSGMGYALVFRRFSDPNLFLEVGDASVIYTAQEDPGYRYKDYIEDIVLGLESHGCDVIPAFRYLRATNNKVFMEILRRELLPAKYHNDCLLCGCIEDLQTEAAKLWYPCVVKAAKGARSRGVYLAKDQKSLIKVAKKVSQTPAFKYMLKDIIRGQKHKGYKAESLYREKFVVQQFIPGLENDWKVLVFHERYYVMRRRNRKGDFRASGSGLFSYDENVDLDLLESAREIYNCLQLPTLSLDLAKSGDKVFLIEMQFVYFGTITLEKSPYYYMKTNLGWQQVKTRSSLEEEYARSVVGFLKRSDR